ALLRTTGPNRAALGAALGLLVALAWFPGFDWPATARAQKLPWVALAGTVIAALLLWRAARGLPTPRPWWRGIALAAVLTVACLGLAAAAGLGLLALGLAAHEGWMGFADPAVTDRLLTSIGALALAGAHLANWRLSHRI
ncbi:MAG: hypothetical protein ACT6Q3_16460, partial [Sphingopyxis sp.]